MRKHFSIILVVFALSGCNTGYDGIVRDPAMAELEAKLASELECEDAIITAGYDSLGEIKGQAIRLIFINSRKVSLDDADKEKKEWCYSISDKFVDNFLEKPYKYDLIQVKFVEKEGLVFRTTRYYGLMNLVGTFDVDTLDQTANDN